MHTLLLLILLAQTPGHGVLPTRSIDPPARPGAMAPNLLVVNGIVWASWIEPAGEQGGRRRLRVARLDDDAWTAPVTAIEGVPFFANWADIPVMNATSSGGLVISWAQKSADDTYAYDVALALSGDDGATWRPIASPHRDGTPTEHGFVSMVAEADGTRLFWLDGRHMAAGADDGEHGHGGGDMTLRTAVVTDGPRQGVQLDGRVCECCNTAAAMTSDGAVVVYRDRDHDEARDIAIVRYDGMEWSSPFLVHADGWRIAGCPVNGPAVDARGDDVAVAWYTGAGEQPSVRIAFSSDAGRTFAPPITVDEGWPLGRVKVLLAAGTAVVTWIDADPDGAAIRMRRVAADGRLGAVVTLAGCSATRGTGFPQVVARDEDLVIAWTDDGETTRIRVVRVPAVAIPAVKP